MLRLGHAPVGAEGGHAAGRALLARMYEDVVGTPLPNIELTPRGKPFFPDLPWHFSITHTPNHVFCALSDKPVGIDAEEIQRPIRMALAEKILSPAEYAQWQQAEDPQLALLAFWVLKEAQSKFTGEGLRGYPKSTAFSLSDPRVTHQHGCLVAVIQGE